MIWSVNGSNMCVSSCVMTASNRLLFTCETIFSLVVENGMCKQHALRMARDSMKLWIYLANTPKSSKNGRCLFDALEDYPYTCLSYYNM